MSQKTADKIAGGKFQAMKGLGHFPATENPKVFVGYGKSCLAMGKIFPAIVDTDRVTLQCSRLLTTSRRLGRESF